jgi:mutual gliding-motility protein MglA
MVVVSYSGREINAKIVYYGPGLSGKTTNLEKIYDSVPETNRGRMVSMKTQTDRTLFFDLLPLDLGDLQGMKTRLLLYTVPGQVYYNATRKLVLKGVDAVVFVADSAPDKMAENRESFSNLEMNLKAYGIDIRTLPWVLQLNKRDLPNATPVAEMVRELNRLNVPVFEAQAANGIGVFETLRGISKLLLAKIAQDVLAKDGGAGASPKAKYAAPSSGASAEPAAAERESTGGKLLKFLKRGKEGAPQAAAPAPERAPAPVAKSEPETESEPPILSEEDFVEAPEAPAAMAEPAPTLSDEELVLSESDIIREEPKIGQSRQRGAAAVERTQPRARTQAIEVDAGGEESGDVRRITVPVDLGDLPASGRVTLTFEVRILVEPNSPAATPRGAARKRAPSGNASGIDETFTRDAEVIS